MLTQVRCIPVSFGGAEFLVYLITSPKVTEKEIETIWRYHTHVYYEVHIIISGTAYFMYENQRITVEEGEMIIFPPGSKHYACPVNINVSEKVLCLSIHQCEGESGHYDMFLSALNNASASPCKLNKELISQILYFNDVIDHDNIHDKCRQKVMAYETIFVLLEELKVFREASEKRVDSLSENELRIALDILINSNYSLSEIAEYLGYSSRHTSRLIHQHYGMRLGEIRQFRMLKAAKDILRQKPNYPMSKIALQVGFPSADSMKRAFLKYEKITPVTYRENIKKESIYEKHD